MALRNQIKHIKMLRNSSNSIFIQQKSYFRGFRVWICVDFVFFSLSLGEMHFARLLYKYHV